MRQNWCLRLISTHLLAYHMRLTVLSNLRAHHHALMWSMSLLELSVLLLELALLITCLLVQVRVIEIFVPLFNCKQNLTTFVTEFEPPSSIIVFVKHFAFCFLSIFDCKVVYEGVRSIFSMRFCLFHPDCSYFAIL